MRVAIIDGKVNADLVRSSIKRYEVLNGKVEESSSNTDFISHGTIVSQIISQYGRYNQIYVLEILNDEEKGNIKNLVTALEWCFNKDIDIINMSVGSTVKKDSKRIRSLCKQLSMQGKVIVAAENNYGIASVPSRFTEVISVKHINCPKIMLYDSSKNRIFVSGEKWMKFANGTYSKTQCCNSYACAVATGVISRKVNILQNDRGKKHYKIIWI